MIYVSTCQPRGYFGSIVARAAGPRRGVGSRYLAGAIQNPRVYYTPDNVLHFEWQRGNGNVEWFELKRVTTSTTTPAGTSALGRECLARLWGGDASNAFHVTTPIDDVPRAPVRTRAPMGRLQP